MLTIAIWSPIETRPKDDTVLVAVEPTEANDTYFGKHGPVVHPAYIDEHGRICDCGTWAPDKGLDGQYWRATKWAPMPEADIDPNLATAINDVLERHRAAEREAA